MCSAEFSCPNKHADVWSLWHFSFWSISVPQISFQGSCAWYRSEYKYLSQFHTSASDSIVYIGSLRDDFVFEELVILNRLFLLTGVGTVLRGGAATAGGTAGVHRAPPGL